MWNHSLRKHNSHLGNNNISFKLPTLIGTWIYLMLQLKQSPCNVFLSITLPFTYEPSYHRHNTLQTLTDKTLTCGKPSSKENVEEFLWGNVSLKVSVEASVVSRATVTGVLGCIRCCWLISVLIILLPLLGIAQHCICIAYCCWERRETFGLCKH